MTRSTPPPMRSDGSARSLSHRRQICRRLGRWLWERADPSLLIGGGVERRAQARNAAGDMTVIAGVGGDTRRAKRHQQFAIRRELAHGVITVVDRVDEILVDGQ